MRTILSSRVGKRAAGTCEQMKSLRLCGEDVQLTDSGIERLDDGYKQRRKGSWGRTDW